MTRALELRETMHAERFYSSTATSGHHGLGGRVGVGSAVANVLLRQDASQKARMVRACDAKNLWWWYLCAPLLPGLRAGGRVELIEPGHPIGCDAAGMLAEELL